jgi:hypothetical protein
VARIERMANSFPHRGLDDRLLHRPEVRVQIHELPHVIA